jgi:hypothetical protein
MKNLNSMLSWRPFDRESTMSPQRVLIAWGWAAVALLFGLYVAVLNHSLERAERVRSGQHAAAKAPPKAGYYASISPRAVHH